MEPHPDVHRRRHQDLLVGRQERGRGEVARDPLRHLRHQVGRRRRDDEKVGIARQLDVSHLGLVGEREQVRVHLVLGQGGDRQRRHERLARLGEDRPDMGAALPEPADQIEALIGRDAPADDEEDALALERRLHGAVKDRGCASAR
jgi:hypothetical protein